MGGIEGGDLMAKRTRTTTVEETLCDACNEVFGAHDTNYNCKHCGKDLCWRCTGYIAIRVQSKWHDELKPFEVPGCLECLRAPYTVAAAALKAVGR